MRLDIVAPLWQRLRHLSLETVFLIIFLFFGSVFAVTVPVGWNTDEPNHTYRIYQLASGDLLSEKTIDPQTGFKAYGGDVPTGLLQLYTGTGTLVPGAVGDRSIKVDPKLYAHHPELLHIKDNGHRQAINFSGSALYSPASYAIYFPVVWLGKLFSMPYFWVIMLCRLMGVICTGLAFYFAIKIIPIGKWVFFAIGLVPAVLVQAATVGADAPQLIVSVLFTAMATRLVFARRYPSWGEYGWFIVLGALLTLIKFTYVPFLLLFMVAALSKREYRNRKHIALVIVTVILALLPGLIWMHLVAYIDINSNPAANIVAQKSFILGDPAQYLKVLYHTFFTNAQMPLANMFGSFIWDSAPLPAMFSYAACATLVASIFVASHRELSIAKLPQVVRNAWRTSLILSSLGASLLIATALYVYSTPLHESSIFSIQSRYFIPIAPLLLLACYGNTVRNQRVVKRSIVVASIFVLIGAYITIYSRLYQTLPPII